MNNSDIPQEEPKRGMSEEEFQKSLVDEQTQVFNENVKSAINLALERAKALKPEGRSELARSYAVIITDLEKVAAYAEKYL